MLVVQSKCFICSEMSGRVGEGEGKDRGRRVETSFIPSVISAQMMTEYTQGKELLHS